jgi:hypothetical protein
VWWVVVVGGGVKIEGAEQERRRNFVKVISGEWEDAARRYKSRCFLVQAEWLWL